ncbi:MAG: orotidine-5'-phosphate decarboxylase [Candidatus Cloacimonetes bacterium]|nr:orotidine-5'-phosphate decarboxylase [Candidatus Cloacimonadota bacterium]
MNFWEKYYHTTKTNRSYVCVGLDSDLSLIPEHLMREQNPILEFNKQIIAATVDQVAAYKLNYAFYISQGQKGLEALKQSIAIIPDHIPVIIDCKIGDIANTMVQYGKAFFEELQADAITVNPLMGEDVITPLSNYKDKMLFLLALTSNPSATDFLKRNQLSKNIATKIAQWGSDQIGAVVGATNTDELSEMRQLMPKTLFLIPGVGAQGGNLSDVMKNALSSKEDPRILINSSRGIIFKERGKDFAKIASIETENLRRAINEYI